VRENGGQYTHAAIWAAMAFAALGDKQHAWELFSMINPVNHAESQERIGAYKVEPYVVAADVYALSPHIGRGGWTWTDFTLLRAFLRIGSRSKSTTGIGRLSITLPSCKRTPRKAG
jgi:hypothetical protein